jgi:hypothetical protein
MNWKKLLLIAVVVGGFAFVAVPQSKAGGHVSIGIGLGFPIGYGYYGCGYPGYYPYAYPAYYPYGYYRPAYYSVGYGYSRPFYWYHGRRIYYGRRWR